MGAAQEAKEWREAGREIEGGKALQKIKEGGIKSEEGRNKTSLIPWSPHGQDTCLGLTGESQSDSFLSISSQVPTPGQEHLLSEHLTPPELCKWLHSEPRDNQIRGAPVCPTPVAQRLALIQEHISPYFSSVHLRRDAPDPGSHGLFPSLLASPVYGPRNPLPRQTPWPHAASALFHVPRPF